MRKHAGRRESRGDYRVQKRPITAISQAHPQYCPSCTRCGSPAVAPAGTKMGRMTHLSVGSYGCRSAQCRKLRNEPRVSASGVSEAPARTGSTRAKNYETNPSPLKTVHEAFRAATIGSGQPRQRNYETNPRSPLLVCPRRQHDASFSSSRERSATAEKLRNEPNVSASGVSKAPAQRIVFFLTQPR